MNTLTNQNQANINTTTEGLKVSRALNFADYIPKLTQEIENAISARDHKDLLLHHLVSFETLIRFDVPLPVRPQLFQKLNNLLSHMSLTHTQDKSLFSVFLNLITILKNQIDAKEQNQIDSNEQEWEELQRSVFLITEWENAVAFNK